MNEHWESLVARVRKLSAMARRGVGGEAENAARKLASLCEKHGIQPEDVESDKRSPRGFRFKGERERCLLVQCARMVAGEGVRGGEPDRRKQVFYFVLNEVEFQDLECCYAHYLPLMHSHMDAAFLAFIGANRITAKNPKRRSVTADDRALLDMASRIALCVDPSQWRRAIGA